MDAGTPYIEAITAIAAVFGAAAAWSGVNAWRSELKGRANFDAARNLLRSVYKIREGFFLVRQRLIVESEFPSGYSGSGGSTPKERKQHASAMAHVFQNRWQALGPAVEEIEAHRIEAEVLLGKDVAEKMEPFLFCVRRLQVGIQSYLEDIEQPDPNDKEFTIQLRKTVFGRRDDKDNELSQEFVQAIAGIESVLLKHLKES